MWTEIEPKILSLFKTELAPALPRKKKCRMSPTGPFPTWIWPCPFAENWPTFTLWCHHLAPAELALMSTYQGHTEDQRHPTKAIPYSVKLKSDAASPEEQVTQGWTPDCTADTRSPAPAHTPAFFSSWETLEGLMQTIP